jgi:hypothetical protein
MPTLPLRKSAPVSRLDVHGDISFNLYLRTGNTNIRIQPASAPGRGWFQFSDISASNQGVPTNVVLDLMSGNSYGGISNRTGNMVVHGGMINFHTGESNILTTGNFSWSTARMTLSNSGNVGIGTTNPTARLQINSAGTNSQLRLLSSHNFDIQSLSNSNGFGFYSTLIGQDMTFKRTGNAREFVARSDGGNIKPLGVLFENGSTRFYNFSQSSTVTDTDVSANAIERLTIMSTGNVGIGTTAPARKCHLHASGSGENAYMKFSVLASGAGLNEGLDIGVDSFGFGTINNRSNFGIAFATNGTNRMILNNIGNVGIGTTNPAAKLHVIGDINYSGNLYGSSNVFMGQNLYGSAPDLRVRPGGVVSTGWFQFYDLSFASGGSNAVMDIAYGANDCLLSARTRRLLVGTKTNGLVLGAYTTAGSLSVLSDGTVVSSSDQRLKTSPVDISFDALNVVSQLKPRHFSWTQDMNSVQLGFIAQEVEDVLPWAVDGKKFEYEFLRDASNNVVLNEDGTPQLDTSKPRYRGFDTNAVVAAAVGAIKQLREIAEAQQERIAALESQLAASSAST